MFARHWWIASFVGLVALVGPSREARSAIVYSNDFETNTNGFDVGTTSTLPTDAGGFASANTSTYLGRFSNDSAVLTLTGLTVGETYTLSFDLFIGASWDGNATNFGPDQWSLVAGSSTLVDTTFINLLPSDGTLNNFTQNYSDTNPVGAGAFAPGTGADVAYLPPNLSYLERYTIYYFGHGAGNPVLTFTATTSDVALALTGSGLQGVGDEFWAIDNVLVESAASVPEPATVGSALLAALGLGLVRRRASAA